MIVCANIAKRNSNNFQTFVTLSQTVSKIRSTPGASSSSNALQVPLTKNDVFPYHMISKRLISNGKQQQHFSQHTQKCHFMSVKEATKIAANSAAAAQANKIIQPTSRKNSKQRNKEYLAKNSSLKQNQETIDNSQNNIGNCHSKLAKLEQKFHETGSPKIQSHMEKQKEKSAKQAVTKKNEKTKITLNS